MCVCGWVGVKGSVRARVSMQVCACVEERPSVCVRERVIMSVCVCVCRREKTRESVCVRDSLCERV